MLLKDERFLKPVQATDGGMAGVVAEDKVNDTQRFLYFPLTITITTITINISITSISTTISIIISDIFSVINKNIVFITISNSITTIITNIRFQCFPLTSILLAVGNTTVNLLSLDIEGAEIQVDH